MSLDDVTAAPLPRLPARPANSRKGDYGRALLIGGSRGMSGAIALAGLAALRSGAGLVTVAAPRTIQHVVAGLNPSLMTRGLADDGLHIAATADDVIAIAEQATVLALGPGLSRSAALTDFVGQLYRQIRQPMVVDADALFALAQRRDALAQPGGPRVLTPHAGEFARLIGKPLDQAKNGPATDEQRHSSAAELARTDPSHKTVVVLKGHNTIVANPQQAAVNSTGNPGMATGGTGDVLTGIITGLLCQGLAPFDAARLGVHVHGLAGDLAANKLGQVSLIASDVIDHLPAAFQAL